MHCLPPQQKTWGLNWDEGWVDPASREGLEVELLYDVLVWRWGIVVWRGFPLCDDSAISFTWFFVPVTAQAMPPAVLDEREALSKVGVPLGRNSLHCWIRASLELTGRVRKLDSRRQDTGWTFPPEKLGKSPCCQVMRSEGWSPSYDLKIKAYTPAAPNGFLIQSSPSYVQAF